MPRLDRGEIMGLSQHVPANCCDETEEKWLRYCCTSRLDPMLLSNCMTVERVVREDPAGEAKCRRPRSEP